MSNPAVESRWWYWIAIEPAVVVLAVVALFVSFRAFLVVFAAFVVVRFVVLGAYFADTRAISNATVEWEPNGGLYVGASFLLGFLLAPVYLYVRHTRVGVP